MEDSAHHKNLGSILYRKFELPSLIIYHPPWKSIHTKPKLIDLYIKVLEMKRARLVGEELCRTFTTNNLIIETNNTMPTMDIETERQLMELKRKMAEVRNICYLPAGRSV